MAIADMFRGRTLDEMHFKLFQVNLIHDSTLRNVM